jgi:hypothetical protein
MRRTQKRLWIVLGASVLALFASLGMGFFGGWGPCGPATVEGIILMTVGILGVLGRAHCSSVARCSDLRAMFGGALVAPNRALPRTAPTWRRGRGAREIYVSL